MKQKLIEQKQNLLNLLPDLIKEQKKMIEIETNIGAERLNDAIQSLINAINDLQVVIDYLHY